MSLSINLSLKAKLNVSILFTLAWVCNVSSSTHSSSIWSKNSLSASSNPVLIWSFSTLIISESRASSSLARFRPASDIPLSSPPACASPHADRSSPFCNSIEPSLIFCKRYTQMRLNYLNEGIEKKISTYSAKYL
jgi:hypothetical protein